MASLDRNLRGQLASAVKAARRVAETGARQSVEQLAVDQPRAWPTMSPEQRQLRTSLREHGRQLGDRRDERTEAQTIERLVSECAYEHWHRLLFARFLAENDLLIEPLSGMSISLEECRNLAREKNQDWLVVASEFAQKMLPQIFRAGDPVLAISLPLEKRQELESMLDGFSPEVFTAGDSLGWVYQFWQAEQKDAVNKSEKKIGADEIPAVTQLFTDDYMVLFLLHNTLGAWWAGKFLAARPDLARSATTEAELRKACALPNIGWEYLRFVRNDDGMWRPAAGAFDGWPKAAKDIRVLDPCMGSGHFLVFALPILLGFRRSEEGLSLADAVCAVLRDNLFGLEIDPRCTQIAAFNLALAAWRMAGHQELPPLHLACSGLGVNATEEEWQELGGPDEGIRFALSCLFPMFRTAATLGSLIDPKRSAAAAYGAMMDVDLIDGLRRVLAPQGAEERQGLGVRAFGIAQAFEILADTFTLVATNVPYLGRGKQDAILKEYCEHAHPAAEADLAMCFIERSLGFCTSGATVALVTPQNCLLLDTYETLRNRLLETKEWNAVAKLGARAFESISGEVVTVALLVLTSRIALDDHAFVAIDASEADTPESKASALEADAITSPLQSSQTGNPSSRIAFDVSAVRTRLGDYADSWQGLVTGDTHRFTVAFWEIADRRHVWSWLVSSPDTTADFVGRELLVKWEQGEGALHRDSKAHNFPPASVVGRTGVLLSQMSNARATRYMGEIFNDLSVPLIPRDVTHLPAILAFCSDSSFTERVRTQTTSLMIRAGYFLGVPFDLSYWQKVAAEKYPNGLPRPYSADPTQWLFGGDPKESDHPLQVAVARLVGSRWPRQTGSSFPDCPALGPDGLEAFADSNGIVCLPSLRGEDSASERLRALLAAAWGPDWSPSTLTELLAGAGFAGKTLDNWLREGFFEQHCALFHRRPFVWQIWDGDRNGFSALVNYHRLAGPHGEGRRILDKLAHTYVGDWIDRQRADQRAGVEGADARVAAAEHLKAELEKIVEGEPPYDIFVRWKPLHEQPVGWEPDLDDGVRLNIRPFITARPLKPAGKTACILRATPKIKWEKDRGREPHRAKNDYPWCWGWDGHTRDFLGGSEFDGNRWNDLHYSRTVKLAARAARGLGAII